LCEIAAMGDRYVPPSAFLQDVLDDIVPLGGSIFGDANLRRMIALTRDPDRANRDWATMLLAQMELDTVAVREALFKAATDEDLYVRGEAILGLAIRDPALALPLIRSALQEEFVCVQIFEAVVQAPDPSLVEALRPFADDGGESIDQLARDAFAACVQAASAQ
jgi:HEAT repeat protein